MTALLLLGSLAAGAVGWFVWSERRRARALVELAAQLEAQHAWQAACFHYAAAANAGADRVLCETRVRDLWNTHGPFQFADTAEELRTKYCAYESCAQGYHAVTLQDIRRIVDTRHPPPSTG